jgi:hypothetical protein
MAVYSGAISVILRNSTMEACFHGGMNDFFRIVPNGTFCTDGQVSRVGFMVEADARVFFGQLVAAGVAQTQSELEGKVAVFVQGVGFLNPCDWLEIGLVRVGGQPQPVAWMAGRDRGHVFSSPGEAEWIESGSSFELLDLKNFDYVGATGGGRETRREKSTDRLVYVGRAYPPVPQRKWWQYWRHP